MKSQTLAASRQFNPSDLAVSSAQSEERRTRVLIIVGSLVVAWANNESLLAHLIAALMKTDQATATVVFATIGNTRGRVELVERLTVLKVQDKALAAAIRNVLKDFSRCTAVRNEFNHCIYGVGPDGDIVNTQGTRLKEGLGVLNLDDPKPFDDIRVAQLADTVRALKKINTEFWDLIARIRAHLHNAAG